MGVRWVKPDQLLDHVAHLRSLAAPTHLNGQQSLLYWSIMFMNLRVLPLMVWSNWKSIVNQDGDTQLVTSPASLPEHEIACAGAAGAAAAPPPARSDDLIDDGPTL